MLLRLGLFLVMAVGLGGMGTLAWIATRPAAPIPVATPLRPAPKPKTAMLVAAGTLRAGMLLKASDVTAQELPPEAVPQGARPDTSAARAELLGAMVRHTLLPGQPVLPGDVMRAGDRGFLAAVLGPGLRAITVGVDAVSGSAWLIWPGDHVDLILTQTLGDQSSAGRQVAGETVLHNARVIAIDQELMQGATAGWVPNNVGGGASNRTVTLEVTQVQAERVAVATRLGHLSLVVISADDPKLVTADHAVAHEAVTWGSDVSAALQGGRTPAGNTLHVFEGGADGKEYHF